VVRLPSFALNTPSAHPGRRHPPHIESAQHSFYYCCAVALLDGACGEPQFTPQRLQLADLSALLDKVELAADPDLDTRWPAAAGGAVELHLNGGAVHHRRCPYPPGHPHMALTDEELAGKFLGHAEPVLTRARAEAL